MGGVAPAILSPCTRVCTLDAGEGPGGRRCTGCGRTLDEIARWTTMSAAERDRVMRRLGGG